MADQGELPLTARAAESILASSCLSASAYLLVAARWVPGGMLAGLVFAGLGGGMLATRALALRFPQTRWLDWAASFWIVPTLVLAHNFFGPLVDALNPRLLDGYLARADLWLFGGIPSTFAQARITPWLMDVLLVCYYSYFFWPFALGLTLFRNRSAYFELLLGMAVFFVLNFALYAAVPAIGPRFFMAPLYEAPLSGQTLTPLLEGWMRVTAFNRDCFPSGHTGFTLVVLAFAFRHARRFFWGMLPVATGLVSATVLGRFHYGVDLICAVPFAALAVCTAVAVGKDRTTSEKRAPFSLRRLVEARAGSRS